MVTPLQKAKLNLYVNIYTAAASSQLTNVDPQAAAEHACVQLEQSVDKGVFQNDYNPDKNST